MGGGGSCDCFLDLSALLMTRGNNTRNFTCVLHKREEEQGGSDWSRQTWVGRKSRQISSQEEVTRRRESLESRRKKRFLLPTPPPKKWTLNLWEVPCKSHTGLLHQFRIQIMLRPKRRVVVIHGLSPLTRLCGHKDHHNPLCLNYLFFPLFLSLRVRERERVEA